MNRKIWKALGIAVCMLALAAPRAMAKTYKVGSDADFKKAVEEINKPGDAKNEIILTESFTLEGNTTDYTLTNGKETTIQGEGHTISIKGSTAGITVAGEKTVLNLGANGYKGTLTIDGKTSGGSASGNAKNAFVSVSGGATANMYENVTLQNGEFAGNACVHVSGEKSVFNLCGGVIQNCVEWTGTCAGAVMVDNQATFNMSGGEILNCISGRFGGGLYAKNSSKITIKGGTISGCRGVMGGGLYVEGSTLTIERGTISGCTADEGGGLYAINSSTNSSTVNISGGTISGCTALIGNGGGLYVDGSTITIEDGTISGCEGNLGCGLYATNSSTVNISGGTISGCEGGRGGGLYANNSTVTITDGTISRCKVGAGGGLFVTGSTLNIEGGTISECSTTFDTGKGGGLYAEENSIITISGGTIKDNEAAHGGGVALTNSTVTDEEPIRNWMVVGNKAYKTGGGIWLGENVKWDISDRTKQIYNNQAIEHGADICLERDNSAITLPNAANMGAFYHNSDIKIDGWYKDDNPRYTPSKDGKPVENLQLSGPLSLVASYKASPVRIEIDANGGKGGSSSQTVHKGTNVILEAPTKEGHLFKGWKDEKGNSYPADADGKVKITVTGDMTLTAVWEAKSFTVTYVLPDGKTRTETADYGQNVTLVEEPRTGYTFVGWKDSEKVYHAGETLTVTGDMTLTAEWKKLPSAENLPKTGDESPVLLWGAALAVSAAACFMLRRRK